MSCGPAYSPLTCSIFPRENQRQVEAFVEANPDFAPVDHQALWASTYPGLEDLARADASGIVLTPAKSETDGFFFALLERKTHGLSRYALLESMTPGLQRLALLEGMMLGLPLRYMRPLSLIRD